MHRTRDGDNGSHPVQPTSSSMPDVLFIKTSSLGDVIHHMPALTEARRRRPDLRFSWLVEEAFAPLVRLHPAVGDVIPVASRRWRKALVKERTWTEVGRFVQRVRARGYDQIIDTQGLFRSALLARIARGRRHGYDVHSVRERPASWLYDVRHRVDRNLHAIARNRTLTGLALGYAPDGAVDFGLDRNQLVSSAHSSQAVLLHATARREKQWPEENWVALARTLAARGLEPLLPWGTNEEHARSQRIAAQVPRARIVERQPLDGTAKVIANAAVVVGVDTGLLHLAAALAIPLVAIFRASEPGLTGPMGHGPISIIGGKGAVPTVDAVIAAVEKIAT
jgi:heptosyltransferase-1